MPPGTSRRMPRVVVAGAGGEGEGLEVGEVRGEALGSREALWGALGGMRGLPPPQSLAEVAVVYRRGEGGAKDGRGLPVRVVVSARTNFTKLAQVAALPGTHIEVTLGRGGATCRAPLA